MSRKIIIDPITRISGPLSVEVEIEKNKIVNAKSSGVQFRGFENMLVGRQPLDLVYFTERICGICSTAHGAVASLALEDAFKIKPDENGEKVRDFAQGTEFIQNIIRQICLFTFPDYVDIENMPGKVDSDFRLSKKLTMKINKDYIKAIEYSRLSHEMLALISGKAPHGHGIFVGGTTVNLDASKIIRLKSMLQSIYNFIAYDMMEDMNIIAENYGEYFKIGAGTPNLLSFGVFGNLTNKQVPYARPSVYMDGKITNLDLKEITEEIAYSWYKNPKSKQVPSREPLETDIKKTQAYTFIKSPRYKGQVFQGGPIARMILSDNYKYSISTMDRLMARALEGKIICEKLLKLLDIIEPIEAVQDKYNVPEMAEGVGMRDAVRGPLVHWISIERGVIKNCDIITPSVWNLSPMDEKGQHGALEAALIGTEIQNVAKPIEIGRIVRSFDPCVSCATQ